MTSCQQSIFIYLPGWSFSVKKHPFSHLAQIVQTQQLISQSIFFVKIYQQGIKPEKPQ